MGTIKKIYDALEEDIIKGVYKSGDKLPSENRLCIKYKASRNAVRDALKKLYYDGYLIVKNRVGYFVTNKLYWTKGISYSLKNMDNVLNETTVIDKKLEKYFVENYLLDEKDYICFLKIRKLEGSYNRISYIWINKKVVGIVLPEDINESTVDFLKKKFTITESINAITIQKLNEQEIELLDMQGFNTSPAYYSIITDDDYKEVLLCSIDKLNNEDMWHLYKSNL